MGTEFCQLIPLSHVAPDCSTEEKYGKLKENNLTGWVGMQGILTNNDYAHKPWFHYDPKKAIEADIGVTKRLSDFILKYADKSCNFYQKAAALLTDRTFNYRFKANIMTELDAQQDKATE